MFEVGDSCWCAGCGLLQRVDKDARGGRALRRVFYQSSQQNLLNGQRQGGIDLARWRSDGNLEFLGRVDDQVKVRGFRIELGEVETVLAACEGVQEAAVIITDDPAGDKTLAAYVIAKPDCRPQAIELRSWMRQQLPEHMVPSDFIEVESLPRTPSGKINRTALSQLGTGRRMLSAVVHPRDEMEEAIAGIWCRVLHRDSVSIFDNFFDVGGHSLLILRVHDAVERLVPRPVKITELFLHPTVASLSAFLTDSEAPNQQVEHGEPQPLLRQSAKQARSKRFANRMASRAGVSD